MRRCERSNGLKLHNARKGKRNPDHYDVFDAVDYNLTIPLWKNARITIGKEKEPCVYEIVGDAAFLPQQERILNPFFFQRNRGIKYSDNFLKDRIALSVGIFNDWKTQHVKFSDGGIQVAGRLTGLPVFAKDGREYLHVGVGARYYGADQGKVRFQGRPESNVIDNYVDTGNIQASHATELAFEALYTNGLYNVLSEYAHAWVSSPVMQDPGFSGFYVTGNYVLTGENRALRSQGRLRSSHYSEISWGSTGSSGPLLSSGSRRQVGQGRHPEQALLWYELVGLDPVEVGRRLWVC